MPCVSSLLVCSSGPGGFGGGGASPFCVRVCACSVRVQHACGCDVTIFSFSSSTNQRRVLCTTSLSSIIQSFKCKTTERTESRLTNNHKNIHCILRSDNKPVSPHVKCHMLISICTQSIPIKTCPRFRIHCLLRA